MFGKNDPVFIGTESALIKKIPGADGMPHQIIDAGHFSQENQAEILLMEFYQFSNEWLPEQGSNLRPID